MLNNLLNEYYVSIFWTANIILFYYTKKNLPFFFYKNFLLFFIPFPNNGLDRPAGHKSAKIKILTNSKKKISNFE
jgi:hypothetical protein